MSFSSRLKQALLSKSLPTSAHAEERLSNAAALAVLSSDVLSSVAYATEEILLVLVAVGSTGLGLSLPIYIQVDVAPTTETTQPQPQKRVIALALGQTQYRILVVDDRTINRLLLIKMLTRVDLEVRKAENGKQAIALWNGYANARNGWVRGNSIY